jgi:ABC-type multidrug transport system fused ATPase/permease subunit
MSNNGQYWIAVSTQVNEVYISNNYGTTFTQVTNSDTSGCYTVGISGNGQYMVIPYYGTNTSGSGTYLLSSDYGANWTKKTYTITTIDAITSIAISNTGQYMTMAASAIISSYNIMIFIVIIICIIIGIIIIVLLMIIVIIIIIVVIIIIT